MILFVRRDLMQMYFFLQLGLLVGFIIPTMCYVTAPTSKKSSFFSRNVEKSPAIDHGMYSLIIDTVFFGTCRE